MKQESVQINSELLDVNGYLDIGLIDTMKDLFVNFIGATVFSMIGGFCIGKKTFLEKIVLAFIPRKRNP